MDEEDLREAEESRTISTSNEFAGFGTEHDALRRSAAIDIFQPTEETIGSKLLTRMGWREGQGIGPRVRRAAHLGDDKEEASELHLFAPNDVEIVSFARKTDHKGLGYESELQGASNVTGKSHDVHRKSLRQHDSSDDDTSSGPLALSKKPAVRTKKTGIGVGVLNDDGSDDDDPYSMGPRISYSKTLGGDKKTRIKSKTASSNANPLLKTKPTFISKKLANLKGALRKCHDGRLPPDGFVLSDQLDSFGSLTMQDDKYKPPAVPAGWESRLSKGDTVVGDSKFVSAAEAAKPSNLSAKVRASILGETQLPGKSVFDFLTPSARDRLAAASGQQDLPTARSEPPPAGYEASSAASTSLQSLVPHLDKATALQALNRGVSGWMPYAEDEKNRSRYRAYLEIQAGLRQDELPPRAEGMSQDEWAIEMQEFTRAAEVFRPVSGLMASRFTSSASLPQGQNIDSSASADSLMTKPMAKPEDPAVSAAKLGMFGPMTRSASNFYPTRLVCKRFNVPYPDHSASMAFDTGNGTASPAGPQGLAMTQPRSFIPPGFQQDNAKVPKPLTERKAPIASGSVAGEDGPDLQPASTKLDPDRNEALEQERPGQAVFKAIFGSDDEDD